MIVQAMNTGTDVASAQFDLAIPGGGFGIYDACTSEWGATSAVWGKQYGGSSTNTCSKFPAALQKGCGFRWDWMQGADNPDVDYEVVSCPAEIVAKSGCGPGSGGATSTNTGGTGTTGGTGSGAATTSGTATTDSDTTGSDTTGSDTTGSDTTGTGATGTNSTSTETGTGTTTTTTTGGADDSCEL